MFVRQNQQQFRNSNADVQIFYGSSGQALLNARSWSKPPGVSNIYMMAIGAGGSGDGTNSGGSGAVTVWYGSAQNVPDVLQILVGADAGSNTLVRFLSGGSQINILQANAGGATGGAGGAATTANTFAASGFYQSIAGQAGTGATQSASSTTFLSGGSGNAGSGFSTIANYGYNTVNAGFFMLQPLIVGCGGNGTGNGGIGCGGGLNAALGGQGMVLIASW